MNVERNRSPPHMPPPTTTHTHTHTCVPAWRAAGSTTPASTDPSKPRRGCGRTWPEPCRQPHGVWGLGSVGRGRGPQLRNPKLSSGPRVRQWRKVLRAPSRPLSDPAGLPHPHPPDRVGEILRSKVLDSPRIEALNPKPPSHLPSLTRLCWRALGGQSRPALGPWRRAAAPPPTP